MDIPNQTSDDDDLTSERESKGCQYNGINKTLVNTELLILHQPYCLLS